jgi:thymidylate synthase
MKILPKLRKCSPNRRGHYFERLIHYPTEQKASTFVNQLEFIINTYVNRHNHRRSALQASLYNPFVDATDAPRLGFPCLQQVAFVPTDGHLAVVAFYPLHYVFERAYGNYLGLAHLGQFMAHEMGLTLTRVICVAGVAKLEVSPSLVKPLNLV